MLNKLDQETIIGEEMGATRKVRATSATAGKRRQRQQKKQDMELDASESSEDRHSSCMSRSSSGCSSRSSVEDPRQVMSGESPTQSLDADDQASDDNCGSSNASDPIEIIGDDSNDEEQQQQRLLGTSLRRQRHLSKASSPTDQLVAKETTRWRKGELQVDSTAQNELVKPQEEFKAKLVWTNIILFVILHSSLPIGIYLAYTQRPYKTLLFSLMGIYASGLGVTGGSHRLWSHRSYKAKWPVQVILVILQTMAGQNSIYTWSRDHRVHHKFAETNADPHNIKRGFFFAHMGWLCCKKHPDVKEKGKLIDMSDLEANPYVMFQHRHFWWMAIAFTMLVPTMIPVLLWGERFWTSFTFSFMVRYLITLHGTWLVNSAAHYYGHRPYDTKIEARESPYVIYNALGEGFHNYHHTFPYDYATSEFGKYLNITTAFIDLCATLGLVEDRRKVDDATIMKRRMRTGDLSQANHKAIVEEGGLEEEGSTESTSGESTTLGNRQIRRRLPASINNIIHELPYISGLFSMKYTM